MRFVMNIKTSGGLCFLLLYYVFIDIAITVMEIIVYPIKPPLYKGRWHGKAVTEGLSIHHDLIGLQSPSHLR